jgi:DNA-binding Lrp family transcriptional regulator
MLTKKEKKVLGCLRENSRMSVSMISEMTDIPPATAFNCLRRLEDRKIISRYTSLLDFSMLMYNVQVNFAVRARKRKELLGYLIGNRNVNSVYRAGSDTDFYFETVFHDMSELYDFIESLDDFGLQSIHEHHVIEAITRERLFERDKEDCAASSTA